MMNRDYLQKQLASFERQRDVAMAQVNQAVGAMAAVKAMLSKLDEAEACPAVVANGHAEHQPNA